MKLHPPDFDGGEKSICDPWIRNIHHLMLHLYHHKIFLWQHKWWACRHHYPLSHASVPVKKVMLNSAALLQWASVRFVVGKPTWLPVVSHLAPSHHSWSNSLATFVFTVGFTDWNPYLDSMRTKGSHETAMSTRYKAMSMSTYSTVWVQPWVQKAWNETQSRRQGACLCSPSDEGTLLEVEIPDFWSYYQAYFLTDGFLTWKT